MGIFLPFYTGMDKQRILDVYFSESLVCGTPVSCSCEFDFEVINDGCLGQIFPVYYSASMIL
jgi:hypothetical protein